MAMNDVQMDTAARGNRTAAPGAAALLASLRDRQAAAAQQRFAERRPEREHTDQLKQRGLFLAVDEPARIAERAARKIGKPHETTALASSVAAEADTPAPSLTAALERLIGRNDLLPIAYFERGALAAQAVGRVVTTDGQRHEVAYGTCFLVAPGVVMTNHHVLPDAATAALSHVQFNYQFGVDGQMQHFDLARIDPDHYLADEDLDFALAGLFEVAGPARPVLPLIDSAAKIINGEPVSIIQHPGAEPKQVALRDNRVVDLLPDFLHYQTDTLSGSSGSPVLNDEWEVVALHHAGVPQTDAGGSVAWVANEGVRISRIVAYLKGLTGLPAALAQMVAGVLGQAGSALHPAGGNGEAATASTPASTPASTAAEAQREPAQPMPSGSHLTLAAGPYVTEINISIRPGDGMAGPGIQRNVLPELSQLARGPAFDSGAMAGTLAGAQPGSAGAAIESATLVEQLQAGDVLLYNGRGLLSDAIKFFTDSDVSHVALFMGGPDGGTIGEAVGAGVIRDSRDQSFPGHNWVMVHRLRAGRDLAPVIARAGFYLDQGLKYAYPQLVFLAILLLVKRLRPSGVLGKMVQSVTMAASEALNRFIESGRDLMICSEFVYRAFDEAAGRAADPYRLEVPGVAREGQSAQPGVEQGSILGQLRARPDLLDGGFSQAAEGMRAAWPLSQEVLEERACTLLAEYLAEQQYGRPTREALVQAFVPDRQTAAAASRFAIALAAVRQRAGGKSRQESLDVATRVIQPSSLPPALQAMFRSPADFITPADLRRSPSLAQVGRVF
jgi:hypothetical protein